MRVLMISGDPSILVPGTPAFDRVSLQRSMVEDVTVAVCTPGRLWEIMRALVLACTQRVDIVTAQDPVWRGLIAVVAARLARSRLQIQVHTDIYSPQFSPLKRRIAVFVLRRADSIRVVSQRITDSLAALSLSARITLLPIYIDLSALHAASPFHFQDAYPQFDEIVLVVARLEQEKRVAMALDVFSDVLRSYPRAGLCIVGDGTQRPALERHARDLGIDQSVIFFGRRQDVFSFYKGANVLLQTSAYEGYGAAVIEALAAELPVVSTDVGIAREAGAVVAEDRKSLATAIVDVLGKKERSALLLPVLNAGQWAEAWKQSL